MMKASEIFRRACGYLSQQEIESEELVVFAPGWLDTIVAEALPFENSLRVFAGTQPLESAPQVTALEDEVPYDDVICRIALPYGLASQFFIDDDNEYRAQDFRSRFISALNDTQKTKMGSVRDVYA